MMLITTSSISLFSLTEPQQASTKASKPMIQIRMRTPKEPNSTKSEKYSDQVLKMVVAHLVGLMELRTI